MSSCRLTCPQPTRLIKEILIPIPSSQYLLTLTSCCTKYVKPTNEGIKFGSYDRVLRRRRGKAFNNAI
uniref:Uncharacterized protein n=1 Tax=viral metagenome TaxID=1070528 RepID=A0A6C0EUZ0_9ZZZZ